MSDPTYGHGEFCWQELGSRDIPACKEFYAAVGGPAAPRRSHALGVMAITRPSSPRAGRPAVPTT